MTRFLLKALLLVLLGAGPGCRCKTGGVDPSELGFRLQTTELDFGRVLEGEVVSKPVSLSATSASDIVVDLSTVPPFSVQPVVRVPGGSSTTFEVKFTAGSTAVSQEVRVTAGAGTAIVKLKGLGVRPKVCVPSAPCLASAYSLEPDACIETMVPEGSACQPDSVCLEKGECRMGLCQGIARTCDDKNSCTVDSCAMDLGCVHTARACPPPTIPCRVASCDPSTGCGEVTAPDGTPCGTVDCVKALLCVAGSCAEVPTPDGFVCGPATPCQGESKCRGQKCVAPDAGVMSPRTVVRLPGTAVDERPSILVQAGNVFFQLCALPAPPDAGPPDSGPSDGGRSDGGRLDGGRSDGGADAGWDAGADGGLEDGGADAGPEGDGGYCALASYTGSGFERWTVHHRDGVPRRLVQVGPRGAVLLREGALELRALSTGALTVIPIEGEVVPRGVAQANDLELWALATSDAGSRLIRWADGGLLEPVGIDAGVSLLAVDENGAAWLYSPDGGALGWLRSLDGGWALRWHNPGPGAASLAVSRGSVVAGARTLVLAEDGGVLPFAWESDAGAPLELLERPVLAGEGAGVAFFRECVSPVMSCLELDKATWMQAFSLADGRFLWRAKVLPEGAPGRVEEVALTGIQPGAAVVLVQVSFDGGSQAFLEGFADGKRLVNCPMPEGTNLAGAVFTPGSMHALITRDGGGWLLESYDLGALPLMSFGWPQADGLSGGRRARY